MMQASVAMAQERFSAARMVREYFEKMYAVGEATETDRPIAGLAPAPPAPQDPART